MTYQRSNAGPSRRRRIVYETSIALARWSLEEGLQRTIKFKAMTGASTVLQCSFRIFISKRKLSGVKLKQRNDAASTIRGLYHIITAKIAVKHRKSELHAESLVEACLYLHETVRSRSALQLVRALRVERQKQVAERYKWSCAVVIQKCWQGMTTRRRTDQLKLTRLRWECATLVVQSFIRTFIAKIRYARCKLKHSHNSKVRIIQVKFRSYLLKMAQRQIIAHRQIAYDKIQSWLRHRMRSGDSAFKRGIVDDIPSGKQFIHNIKVEQCTVNEKVLKDDEFSISPSDERGQSSFSLQNMFARRIQRSFRFRHHYLQHCKTQNDAVTKIARTCRIKISQRKRNESTHCRRQQVSAKILQCTIRQFLARKYVRDLRTPLQHYY